MAKMFPPEMVDIGSPGERDIFYRLKNEGPQKWHIFHSARFTPRKGILREIDFLLLVPFPVGFVDTGKSPPTLDSRASGNDGQVKRVSGIRHIQMETVLVVRNLCNDELIGTGPLP